MDDLPDAEMATIVSAVRQKNEVFRKACVEMNLLNDKIRVIQTRYDRAEKSQRLAYQSMLRMQLTPLVSLRQLMYAFACEKLQEITELENRMQQSTPVT